MGAYFLERRCGSLDSEQEYLYHQKNKIIHNFFYYLKENLLIVMLIFVAFCP